MFSLLVVCLACFVSTRGDEIACAPNPGPAAPREIDANNPTSFQTPGFNYSDPAGSQYPQDYTCDWLITVDAGQQLELSFWSFSIEGCTQCSCDTVDVYDGPNIDPANLVRTLCGDLGDQVPDPIETNSGALRVVFKSDDYATTDRGFLARVGFPITSVACEAGRPQILDTESPGMFWTDNYPVNYENNDRCEWRFEAPAGQRVEIEFYEFNVESCCNCDVLEARNGGALSSPLQAYFYDDHRPARLISAGNLLYLSFNADESITGPGFAGYYRFIT